VALLGVCTFLVSLMISLTSCTPQEQKVTSTKHLEFDAQENIYVSSDEGTSSWKYRCK
jgi:hypothetical protein